MSTAVNTHGAAVLAAIEAWRITDAAYVTYTEKAAGGVSAATEYAAWLALSNLAVYADYAAGGAS